MNENELNCLRWFSTEKNCLVTSLDCSNTIAAAINKEFCINASECRQIMDTLYAMGFIKIRGDLCNCFMTPNGVYAKRTTQEGDEYLTSIDLS